VAIAMKSAGNMSVAMNGSANICAGMTPAQVVAEHARLVPLFQAKYPVGGVAALSSAEDTQQTQIDPRHKARVNAVRFQK
jgi:hypothetical protein